MSDLMYLAIACAAGVWAWRQWKGLHPLPSGRKAIVPAETVTAELWEFHTPAEAAPLQPGAMPGPPLPGETWRMNKWVVLGLCVAWIISPLDGDFVPVIGWVDDFFAAYIAYRRLKK
jgi:hypothetical protein